MRVGVFTGALVISALTLSACETSPSDPAAAPRASAPPTSAAAMPTTTQTTTSPTPPTTSPSVSVSVTSGIPSTSGPAPTLSVDAERYLDEAIDLMRRWSINRDGVDWVAVEELADRHADGADTPADTYPAIRAAMRLLRDGHSVFLTPEEADRFANGRADFDEPVVEVREGEIGYVSVGRYSGDIGEQADAYASALASDLGEALPNTCGWIVDLRSNSGGNMWPMIGGLAPLIGTGQVGSFVYPDGTVESWTLDGGIASWDGQPMTAYAVDATFDGPVAVLIGPRTGSSGEATAIALQGRADTRFFGQATSGLTTSNEPLVLSDGALLILTMSVFTDRDGVPYGQDIPVEPDVLLGADPTDEAAEWLASHPACAA